MSIRSDEVNQMRRNIKRLSLLTATLLLVQISIAQKIDVTKYMINLEITDFQNRMIEGYCDVSLKAEGGDKTYSLDLLQLTVDSVQDASDQSALTFNHASEKLNITWPTAFGNDEERTVRVYYHGTPARDATWGGFYFSGAYAFNLGVGFAADPHNYGRVWFPCNDVFTDRAIFEFKIETTSDKKALCNGLLQSETTLPNGNTEYHWLMRDPIPTYLASVAVAPYHLLQDTLSGIPVTLAGVEADTANMTASFENLDNCVETFLTQYGPHTFERIGFNLVPFNGGAMEHATNIAYPRFGAAGNKNYETLWAHELAHHWFGNNITCASQEHMWINEGWASFSERVFLEGMYGKDRYKEDISSNHRAVLHYAHLRDGAALPVAGIGHANTYGSHVYDKGAEVAHTLRGHMGDEDFFKAVRALMVDYKFQSINTDQMQAHFQKFTSVDLAAFFKHWVNSPGFPHYDVIERKTMQVGNKFSHTVSIRQRNRFAPDRFDKTVLELTFYDKDWKEETVQVTLNDSYRQDVIVETSIDPVWVVVDKEEKMSDAITDYQQVISANGTYDFRDALMEVEVTEIADSALVRVEHNWVSPDHYFNPTNYPVLSSERYWTVSGLWPETFKANATIEYNGSTPGSNYANGYLDNQLIKKTEDSLVLMYRENAGMNWREYPDYEKTTRTKLDKKGVILIKDLKPGEYAFAMYDRALASNAGKVEVPQKANGKIKIYPNPSDSVVKFEWKKKVQGTLEVTDYTGKVIHKETIDKKKCEYTLDVRDMKRGIYYVGLIVDNQPYQLNPFFVR